MLVCYHQGYSRSGLADWLGLKEDYNYPRARSWRTRRGRTVPVPLSSLALAAAAFLGFAAPRSGPAPSRLLVQAHWQSRRRTSTVAHLSVLGSTHNQARKSSPRPGPPPPGPRFPSAAESGNGDRLSSPFPGPIGDRGSGNWGFPGLPTTPRPCHRDCGGQRQVPPCRGQAHHGLETGGRTPGSSMPALHPPIPLRVMLADDARPRRSGFIGRRGPAMGQGPANDT